LQRISNRKSAISFCNQIFAEAQKKAGNGSAAARETVRSWGLGQRPDKQKARFVYMLALLATFVCRNRFTVHLG